MNDFFRTTIVEAINGRCFCDFPEANLINGTAVCPRDGSRDLVYRAYIVNLDHLTSSQLLRYVDDWVRSEPYVSSGVAVIRFSPNCSTSVSSADETVCAGPVLQGTTGFPLGTTGILIVTLVGAMILFIVLTLVCIIVLQQKQLRSLSEQ